METNQLEVSARRMPPFGIPDYFPTVRIACLLCALLCAGSLRAQQQKHPGINLSLWKNIATQRNDTTGRTVFNLGLASAMNRLDGAGINVLGSTVAQSANGLQVSGIFHMTGGDLNGLQLAGITNVNGNSLRGVSLSGLVGITGNQTKGILGSGLASIAGGESKGVVLGGLLSMTDGESAGFFWGGLGNINREDLSGVSAAGLVDIVGKDLRGVQVAGITNIVAGEMNGMQLSPFNVAVRAKGVQIGLVNYYQEKLDGFQLGLVNANPKTRVQLMVFGGNVAKLNLGARFKNELFYTILGGGTHYLDFGNKFSAAFFYRAGVELPLYKRLFVSGDLGYQHIETFKNKEAGLPARLYALQARLNLEYRIARRFGLFLTGGYGITRYYTHRGTFDKGMLLEGGCVIFSY